VPDPYRAGSDAATQPGDGRVVLRAPVRARRWHPCRFRTSRLYGQCRNGGWALGHTIDGVQAEYASRRETAPKLGAPHAVGEAEVHGLVDELSDALGADVTIEAVGFPDAFELTADLVRPAAGSPTSANFDSTST
jgi:threonine dehydrogenase-like Zn-dependent dehydrogenase